MQKARLLPREMRQQSLLASPWLSQLLRAGAKLRHVIDVVERVIFKGSSRLDCLK
jgi:hypothetical protein